MDQRQTTEGALYESLFPPKDLAYWLGKALNYPVSDIPTAEDLAREQGQIGLPTEAQTARQTGQGALDYVTQLLGPLMALMGSQQYARQKSGKPAQTWGEQSPYTKANSPLEQLLNWQKVEPWKDKPPIGESAWTYRSPPQIGGPTGRGMTKEEVLAAIEKEKFQGMLKQIREQERLEALKPPRPPAAGRPAQGQQIDDDRLDWMIQQMWKQGGTDPDGPFTLPPLPGD